MITLFMTMLKIEHYLELCEIWIVDGIEISWELNRLCLGEKKDTQINFCWELRDL